MRIVPISLETRGTVMMQGPVAIILAAGHGKRMKSEKAKVLHEVCGRPMIRYVVEAVRGAGAKTIVVVVGYGADQVRAALADEPDVLFATQERQLGTGDAVRACRPLLDGYEGPALVLVGDEPLIRPEPLADLLARQQAEQAACLLGTAIVPDPTGFGRILRDSAGRFLRIVEERDCSPEEKAIREVNPSCYVFELPGLWDALDRLDTGNAQGEYYLTDAPDLLQSMGRKVVALPVPRARRHPRRQHPPAPRPGPRDHAGADPGPLDDRRGEHRRPPEHLHRRPGQIGRDTIIFPFTVITGRVTIGADCRVGPFAHLRDGTVLDDGVEVGAFVESTRSTLGDGALAGTWPTWATRPSAPTRNIGAGA